MSVHRCHARGCSTPVPPAMFMCKPHWFALPKRMRDAVWANYQPGQEERRVSPTEKYLDVTDEAIEWLWNHEHPRAPDGGAGGGK